MDTTLKQRLIGAVVLIALAVIFLPMLVQGPAPDSGVADVSLRVPDAPGGQYETRELPLAGPAPAAPAAATDPVPDPAAAAPADTAAATAAPDVAAGDWAVSFGAYSTEKDAQAVRARLLAAGLQGFIDPAEQNGRKVWRVRVGPYPDRALAEAGRLQAIRIRDDVKAQVIALNAPAAAPEAAAAASQAQAAPATAAVRSETLPADPAPAPARTASTASTAAPAPSRAVDAPSAAAASTTPARAESRPATPAATSTPATPAPAPATPAASGVGFAVQMGAFSREADAVALRDQLRAAGFSALVQPVRTDKGTLNRVRVGPVLSREEAVQLKSRLARFGEGNVVSHP